MGHFCITRNSTKMQFQFFLCISQLQYYCQLLLLYFDTDPEDYTGVTTPVTFVLGVTAQNVSVPTIDDSNSEGTESFTAMLSNPSPSDVVRITQPLATINIADNDSKKFC